MKILSWIVQILISLAFLATGAMKLFTPYGELVEREGMQWVGDFSSLQIKIIGILEILGSLGLIVPMILKRYRFLVPLAAIGLSLTMLGAIVTHALRSEPVVVNAVLLVLALLIFYWRRGFLKKSA